MAQLIAIDWDPREARIVAATTQGRGLRIEAAFHLPWTVEGVPESEAATRRGEMLKAALRERGIGRGDVVATIGRAGVELKQLSLPPAPDEELPDLVRFQAQREFHALSTDAPLDFIPVAAGEGEPRSVLAAVCDPALLAEVRQTCDEAGLRLRRALLRPCATASLIARQLPPDDDVPRLLVDASADEAEVTALTGRTIALLRAARMPGEPQSPDYARALSSELRRTTAAVQHQLGGRRVAEIRLCGTRGEPAAAVERLSADLESPVTTVDPWDLLPAEVTTASPPPESGGRYTPLLGALCDEAEGVAPALDFANPRRPPAPIDYRRRILVGAACAAAAVALTWATIAVKLSNLDGEIAGLRTQSQALDQAVKTADELGRRADEIEKWLQGDVVWLDELERLSRQFPPAERAMVTQLRFGAHPQGGVMQVTGLIAEAAVGDALEKQLRDERHAVEGRGRRQEQQAGRYPWRFQSDVVVKTDGAAAPPSSGGR